MRGMQSSVPKINIGKCLLTVGTDVKNVMEGRGGKGREGDGRRGPGSVFYVDAELNCTIGQIDQMNNYILLMA